MQEIEIPNSSIHEKKKKKKLRCNALKVGTPLQHCQIAGTSLSKEYRGERETCHAAVI